MMRIKSWIEAARLRTLPLSLSGILVGSFIALHQGFWQWNIFLLALLTTLFFQILSNFANDLGDSYKGADNDQRLGPIRGIQAGIITRKQMIVGIVVVSILSLVTAVPLVIMGTLNRPISILLFYLVLAGLCILAAITYTVGKKAYGYHGMGDVMVFIFFGWVSVIGVFYLYSNALDWSILLPASSIGLLSAGVLNMNNMRDIENDKNSGKHTIVVGLGWKKAKVYQVGLILSSLVLLLIFIIITKWWALFIALLPYIRLIRHGIKVIKTEEPKRLDSELKVVSLSTFAIALLFLLSTII